jgi:hypothetical protein
LWLFQFSEQLFAFYIADKLETGFN